MTEKEVLANINSGLMFYLKPENFEGRHMTTEEVVAIFDSLQAFWMYQGPPCKEKPHALLKSERHSNGFVMCKDVLDHMVLCTLFANEMVKVIRERLSEAQISRIDIVASSAYSALGLGHEVARLLAERYNPKIKHIQVEKDVNGNPTIVRGGIDVNKTVLILNELMTTGSGSTYETRKAILECNGAGKVGPRVITPAFVFVHRSKDEKMADGTDIAWAFHFDIGNSEPDNCDYCKAGSEAIKPKIGDGTNWKRLHGRV